jgi:hypothetical protein
MASAGAIRAGRAFIELFADGRKLAAGLKAAADKVKQFGATASRLGKKMAILGAGMTAPIVMASKAIANLNDETKLLAAQKLGVMVTTEDVEKAQKFGDALEAVRLQAALLGSKIASAVLPAVEKLSQFIGKMSIPIGSFVSSNGELVQILASVAAGAVAAGAALVAIGTTASIIGTVASALVLFVNPLTISLGLATALFAALYKFGALDGILASIADGFENVGASIGEAKKGIAAALSVGDVKKAMEIIGITMELEWERIIAGLEKKWNEFMVSASVPDYLGGMKGVNAEQAASEENLRKVRIKGMETRLAIAVKGSVDNAAGVQADKDAKAANEAAQAEFAKQSQSQLEGMFTNRNHNAWQELATGFYDAMSAGMENVNYSPAAQAVKDALGGPIDILGNAFGSLSDGLSEATQAAFGDIKLGMKEAIASEPISAAAGMTGGVRAGQVLGGQRTQVDIERNTREAVTILDEIRRKKGGVILGF